MNICTEEVDRLRALPSKILCDILALLSTKGVVATSVLSKRWQYVWTDVPVLQFTDFPAPTAVAPLDKEKFVRYKNFVNRVLFLNNVSCLERVDLECHDGFSPSNVYEWMLVFANRSVKELRLITSLQSVIKLPSTLVLHKDNLVDLTLSGKLELCVPSSIHLPGLIHLSFTHVLFRGTDDPLSIFVSGCPALKVLSADDCLGFYKISVCSNSLRILQIVSIRSVGLVQQSITIKAPKLQRLHLAMCIGLSSISELPSLVTALLRVRISAVMFVKLLERCHSVKTLILCNDGPSTINQLPKFHHLRQLIVYFTSWSIVLQLLRNAPNLDSLIIHQVMFSWPEIKITELALKRIEYHSVDIGDKDLEVLRYFLSSCKLLNKLKVNVKRWKSRKSEIQTLKRLLEFPRASATCRISVVDADEDDDDSDTGIDSTTSSEDENC